MMRQIKRLWKMEPVRYLFVGGVAFLADKITFFLLNTLLLPDLGSYGPIESIKNMLSVISAFAVGTAVNNGLSISLVFRSKKKNPVKTHVLFTAVGIAGLLFSIAANQICVKVLGDGAVKELCYNIAIAIPVTLWNYLGRKICVSYT